LSFVLRENIRLLLQKQNPEDPTAEIIDEEAETHRKDATSPMIYREAAVRRVEDILVNFIFCLTILLPIFLLYFLKSTIGRLTVVLGFVGFAAVVTSFMANTVHKNTFAVLAT
jgi:hypothetical protein